MSVFPQMGIIEEEVWTTINSRKDNNVDTSTLMSWIRVASAVDEGLILETIPDKQTFASTYGTTNKSGRVGTTFAGNDVFALGSDRGFRPSPVIDSLNIENGHQGLSRKSTFTITCFTLAQAEKITQYFYEPGNMVLIEFGWNTAKSMEERVDLSDNGACQMAKFNSYPFVRNKRKNSLGTYDGFLGRISGGGYKSGTGETYIIDVELVTMGEIPAYLQTHKSGRTKNANDSSNQFSISQIDSMSEKPGGILRALGLFMQVYNKLPAEKRTEKVKTLTDPNARDKMDLAWLQEENFINVDVKQREALVKALEKSEPILPDGTTGKKLPEGIPFISDHSYIRMELAFKILNTYAVNLESDKSTKCSGEISTYNYTINTEDTVIGAHKYMFSTNGSKLFIPNTNAPNFGIETVLSASDRLKPTDFVNPYHINKNTTNISPFREVATGLYDFPRTEPYQGPKLDGTIQRTAPAHDWGYLRDLYINLDFFANVMSRGGFVLKDVLYEILNEITLAAGSYWHFEIVETPYNPEPINKIKNTALGTMMLTVQDYNFLGLEKPVKTDIRELYSKGVDSPFLESALDMPIPAVMRNQIIFNKATPKVTDVKEKPVERYGFWDGEPDPVLEILNPIQSDVSDNKAHKDIPEPTEKELIKSNLEYFTNIATVVQSPNPRSTEVSEDSYLQRLTKFFDSKDYKTLTDVVFVCAWDDVFLLKEVELMWRFEQENGKTYEQALKDAAGNLEKLQSVSLESSSVTPLAVSPILGIEFTFTIHGVSGLKIGDTFVVPDLPSKFKSGVFQVMQQSQALSDGLWKTSVSAKLRNFTI